MLNRLERAVRQLEKIYQGDSAQAIGLLRAVIEEHRGSARFNETRTVREIERLQTRATLSVQDIEALARRIAAETLP